MLRTLAYVCVLLREDAEIASGVGDHRPAHAGAGRCGSWHGRVGVPGQVAVAPGAVPAGHRDVELGVAPHAVLGDVETGGLGLLLDADSDRLLHDPERPEGRAEGPHADRDEAER